MKTPSLFHAPPLQQAPAPVSPAVQASQTNPAQGQGQAQGSSSALVPLTQDDVKKALPRNLHSGVTQGLVDTLNTISADPIMAENIRDNFLGYSAVLKEGKFKADDYLNAVAYVSYKLMGFNNEESYARTFPARYQALLAKGTSKKDVGGYVSAYHRGKLVNLIMEQSLVPTWVLNQDLFQKALNVQADLMVNANSEKVRTDAANSILNHLKKPENRDFQISMDAGESSGMKEMRNMLGQLAQQQRELIEQGQMKTIDVAASRLVPKEEEAEDIETVPGEPVNV